MSNAVVEATQETAPTFENVARLVNQMRPIDQARIVALLAPKIADSIEKSELEVSQTPKPKGAPFRGALADLGPAPSAEEIDEARREMWGDFAGAKFDDI